MMHLSVVREAPGEADTHHGGPLAGDFRALLDVGEAGTVIEPTDAESVLFAAVQGLTERLAARDDRLREQADRLDDLEERLSALEARPDHGEPPSDT
jgi:hypothetical protein